MRFYYIFVVKEEFTKKAHESPNNFYKILESIYMNGENNIEMANRLFSRITYPIDMENISTLIKEINSENLNYTCFKTIHHINDFLRGESSKMILNEYYMLIKSNCDFPSFFKDIKNIKNLFVCDFINEDYFFLKEIMSCSKVK